MAYENRDNTSLMLSTFTREEFVREHTAVGNRYHNNSLRKGQGSSRTKLTKQIANKRVTTIVLIFGFKCQPQLLLKQMAGSPNSHRSKYGMVQASRSVLRWFSLSEEPQETRSRTATVTQRRSKTLHSQRKASKTKRKLPTRGVSNVASEKRKGLEPREQSEMEHAAVTVNLISEKRTSSDEEMEFGEHIEGEEGDAEGYEENDDDNDGQSDVGTSDLLTETSSVITEEQILLPNIVIPCSKCGEVINICRLQGHRNLHSALKVFKYSHHQRPKDLNSLVRRRRTLIQQHRDQASSSDHQQFFGYKHLHKINTAFEVLRSELNRNMGLPSLNEPNIKGMYIISNFDLCQRLTEKPFLKVFSMILKVFGRQSRRN